MKKMRRLIPAIAMLLVSAVMLSTASFAWFTMNDQVTASGMQIQAKSTGSLVISDAPLTNASTKTEADLQVTAAATIKPITWDTDAWKVAPQTNQAVDPITGIATGDLVEVEAPGTEYVIDKEVYIGSAGDTMEHQSIKINLSAIAGANELASKAYAVALYVIAKGEDGWADNAPVDNTKEPDGIIYTDSLKSPGNNVVFNRNQIILKGAPHMNGETPVTNSAGDALYAGYTIPTIIGVEGKDANDNAITTGLKVVLRFFVDGNLDALSADQTLATKPYANYEYIEIGETYKDSANATQTVSKQYNANLTYYKLDDAGEYVVVNTANLTDAEKQDMTTAPGYGDGWYVYIANYTQENYKYVNSDEVPTTGTSLQVTFSVNTLEQPAQAQG